LTVDRISVVGGIRTRAIVRSADSNFDAVIRNGVIYDGTGSTAFRGDVAIKGDLIAAIGSNLGRGVAEIEATDLAVSPGFINMLSWGVESLIADGRGQSDLRQGVTLEVFGEGDSMGPLSEEMKRDVVERQGDIKYDVKWTTLGEGLEYLVKRGVSPNVASFVGATTVRIHELGYEDRSASAEEVTMMCDLVRQAMKEGALGLGSSLIYAPAFYAPTEELIELAKVVGEYGGLYISHIRSEGSRVLEAVDELTRIAREANVRAEIYHLKVAGRSNWEKRDHVIARIEAARREGLQITADMYPYAASGTGLDAVMPPWVQEGGHEEWVKRLKDPDIRRRVEEEMCTPTDEWENMYLGTGPENMVLAAFKSEKLKPLAGKTLATIAAMRGKSPPQTVMDLVIEDDSRVGTIYFSMSEADVRRNAALPWVSLGSDAGCISPEGVFMKTLPHPRAYGTFARFLGKYVREEKVTTLEDAIRRLTSLPAGNLKLKRRGMLKTGNFADIVVFDPTKVRDNATFDKPAQYSTGVVHVLVNGVPVVKDGEHTNAKLGRVVHGPGWEGWN
jgi:N-acyl-D-amino-acid deacylase